MKKIFDKIKLRQNNRGFTLVELLAVIAILAIVSVIVVYTGVDVIDSAKKKSYQVTINDVEEVAESYVLENKNDMFWINDDGDNNLYQCITVQNLIDTGYFKGDILESKVDEERNILASDNIYLSIDNITKAVNKSILLYDDESSFSELCNQTNLDGYIGFKIPSGWSREKDVTITYRLSSRVGITSGYKYNYLQDNDSNVKKDDTNFNNLKHTEIDKVTKNGTLYASILDNNGNAIVTKSFVVSGIDNEGPVIALGDYNGNSVVVGNVVIPLKVTDIGSGVDSNSFTSSDIVVSIGDNVLTSGVTLEKIDDNNYNLKIENYDYEGPVKITVDKDKIFDKLENGNEEVELIPGISFINKFIIKYDKNGGTGTMTSTECFNGRSCTLSSNTFKRKGYTFLGWSEDKTASSATYSNNYTFDSFNEKRDITLYAVWKDSNGPIITIGTNGNSSYAMSVSTNIIVTDNESGGDTSTYKYIYSASNSATPNTGFTSGSSYSLSSVTGIYYLIVKACDKAENCTTEVSNKFYLDNTKPTCSLSVTTSGIKFKSTSDNIGVSSSGLSTSSSASYGTTSLSLSTGTKYGYVKDSAGNTGTCSVVVTSTTKNTTKTCKYNEDAGGCYYSNPATPSTKVDGSCTCRDPSVNNPGYTFGICTTSGCSCSSGLVVRTNSCTTTTTYSCSSGTLSGKYCKVYTSYSTSTSYTCSSGYTKLNDSYCYK